MGLQSDSLTEDQKRRAAVSHSRRRSSRSRRDPGPGFIVWFGVALVAFFTGMAFTHWCMVNGYLV